MARQSGDKGLVWRWLPNQPNTWISRLVGTLANVCTREPEPHTNALTMREWQAERSWVHQAAHIPPFQLHQTLAILTHTEPHTTLARFAPFGTRVSPHRSPADRPLALETNTSSKVPKGTQASQGAQGAEDDAVHEIPGRNWNALDRRHRTSDGIDATWRGCRKMLAWTRLEIGPGLTSSAQDTRSGDNLGQ